MQQISEGRHWPLFRTKLSTACLSWFLYKDSREPIAWLLKLRLVRFNLNLELVLMFPHISTNLRNLQLIFSQNQTSPSPSILFHSTPHIHHPTIHPELTNLAPTTFPTISPSPHFIIASPSFAVNTIVTSSFSVFLSPFSCFDPFSTGDFDISVVFHPSFKQNLQRMTVGGMNEAPPPPRVREICSYCLE